MHSHQKNDPRPARRYNTICGPFLAAAAILIFSASPARSTLPDIPQGVAVLNTIGDKGLRDGILGNLDVTMISILGSWADVQPDEATFDFHLPQDAIDKVTVYPDKSILMRLETMGGSRTNGGNTPDWVFTAMGVDPSKLDAHPGVTYAYVDSDNVPHCIPVFWQPVYLAKKRALIAMAGANFASNAAIKS
jgi:hypothetical protein